MILVNYRLLNLFWWFRHFSGPGIADFIGSWMRLPYYCKVYGSDKLMNTISTLTWVTNKFLHYTLSLFSLPACGFCCHEKCLNLITRTCASVKVDLDVSKISNFCQLWAWIKSKFPCLPFTGERKSILHPEHLSWERSSCSKLPLPWMSYSAVISLVVFSLCLSFQSVNQAPSSLMLMTHFCLISYAPVQSQSLAFTSPVIVTTLVSTTVIFAIGMTPWSSLPGFYTTGTLNPKKCVHWTSSYPPNQLNSCFPPWWLMDIDFLSRFAEPQSSFWGSCLIRLCSEFRILIRCCSVLLRSWMKSRSV